MTKYEELQAAVRNLDMADWTYVRSKIDPKTGEMVDVFTKGVKGCTFMMKLPRVIPDPASIA